MESFFVVGVKTYLQYKCIKWRRRQPKRILTDTTLLRDLFDKTIFKNDKDRSGSGEPYLFNF